MRGLHIRSLSALACGLLWLACSKSAPTQAPPTQAPTAANEAPARDLREEVAVGTVAVPAVEAAPDPAIGAALAEIIDRHKCNRLMGCAPRDVLATHGVAALPGVLELLDTGKARDGYWIIALLDLLGGVEDDRAVATLESWVSDKRWEVRTRAALGLAQQRRPQSREVLLAALAGCRDKGDLAFEAGVLYALDRLGATVDDKPARAALVERLALDYEALATMNPGFYAALAEIIALAKLSEALPVLRLGITHRDRYARIASIEAAATLSDTGAIPFLVGRLTDPLPSVKRASIAALRAITGSEALRDAEQWATWCDETKCRDDLRSGMPSGTPALAEGESVGPGLAQPPAPPAP
ncbi:MAG: HEAT repeat domain-containing protein [Myxococcota bacterium]